MMEVELQCGRGTIAIQVPENSRVIETKPYPSLPDPVEAVREALSSPIQSRTLLELARHRRSACIVVSDATRPVPNTIILPPILESLHQAGLKEADITILIATGMHDPVDRESLLELLGQDIPARYRVVNHDCFDADRNRKLLEIDGRPIEIDGVYLDADLKILTGLIEPHHIAGYSGGAKSVLPGVASFGSMKFMHSFKMLDHPSVATTEIKKNPFQNYARKTALTAGTDFVVNVLIDKSKQIRGVFAGSLEAAHNAGCRVAEEHTLTVLDQPADAIIVSAAGYPIDATFYQACKGIISAREAAAPGAKVLLIADCGQGIGGEAFCWMLERFGGPEEFDGHFCREENFIIDQWAGQRYYQAMGRFSEMLLFAPGLGDVDVSRFGLSRVIELQSVVDRLASRSRNLIVVPEGPFVTIKSPTG